MQNLDIGGHTDEGRRDHNEDAFLIDRQLGLVVVADGVGGHQSGEVASAITCEVLQREIAAGVDLRQAIYQANTDVIAAVHSGRGKPGMGSTVVAVLLQDDGYEVVWVGDSRVYLWDGKLSLLTRDHSFVEQQLASGRITREEARNHPRRHVILQAVGSQPTDSLEVGRNAGQLAPGSCLLLCSDGVNDPLDNAQLCQLLSQATTAEKTCQRLVDLALQCGGKDNATAVLIARNGSQQDSPTIVKPDQVVWVYDPATANYEDLQDVTLRHPREENALEDTQILRIKPGSLSAVQPADATSGGRIAGSRLGRAWRYFWRAGLLATIVVALAYLVLR